MTDQRVCEDRTLCGTLELVSVDVLPGQRILSHEVTARSVCGVDEA